MDRLHQFRNWALTRREQRPFSIQINNVKGERRVKQAMPLLYSEAPAQFGRQLFLPWTCVREAKSLRGILEQDDLFELPVKALPRTADQIVNFLVRLSVPFTEVRGRQSPVAITLQDLGSLQHEHVNRP